MPTEAELLQSKLDAFLRIAANNEKKHENFQTYELSLMNCTGLFDLLSLILHTHREKFQLTEVTLVLLDAEYELQRILELNPKPKSWQGRLLFASSEIELKNTFHISNRPKLSSYDNQRHQAAFPQHAASIRSVAILPLKRQNKVIGSLNLASRQQDRFQPNIGTLFLEHLTAVISACIENARLQEQIKQLGLIDPLTGINNRRFFEQRIAEEVTLARRNGTSLSCLFLDLDHFKQINDNYGHQSGDNVLKQAATIFNDFMRTTDTVARYGGEEFVIILSNTDSDIAYEIAERIRKNMAKHPFEIVDQESIHVTVSVGLATMDKNSAICTTAQLLASADQAVYSAKNAGRNTVQRAN